MKQNRLYVSLVASREGNERVARYVAVAQVSSCPDHQHSLQIHRPGLQLVLLHLLIVRAVVRC